jgi:hypothetical protein
LTNLSTVTSLKFQNFIELLVVLDELWSGKLVTVSGALLMILY